MSKKGFLPPLFMEDFWPKTGPDLFAKEVLGLKDPPAVEAVKAKLKTQEDVNALMAEVAAKPPTTLEEQKEYAKKHHESKLAQVQAMVNAITAGVVIPGLDPLPFLEPKFEVPEDLASKAMGYGLMYGPGKVKVPTITPLDIGDLKVTPDGELELTPAGVTPMLPETKAPKNGMTFFGLDYAELEKKVLTSYVAHTGINLDDSPSSFVSILIEKAVLETTKWLSQVWKPSWMMTLGDAIQMYETNKAATPMQGARSKWLELKIERLLKRMEETCAKLPPVATLDHLQHAVAVNEWLETYFGYDEPMRRYLMDTVDTDQLYWLIRSCPLDPEEYQKIIPDNDDDGPKAVG